MIRGITASTVTAQQPVTHEAAIRAPWHILAAWVDSLADSGTVTIAVQAALVLGDADQAARLLGRHGPLLEDARRMELAAAVAEARGEWGPAARAFHAAALLRGGRAGAMLEARAARALESGGERDSAAAAYARARALLPSIAGWLAVREASLILDARMAEDLLARAPPEARPLVLEARARLRLLEGNPAAAESLLAAATRAGHAAELALARGDTLTALRYAAAAMQAPDTVDVRRAVVLIPHMLDAATAAELMTAARGAARIRSTREAAAWGREAIARGDSTPSTLLTVGGWLEAIGQRRASLDFYRRAGTPGEFPHARARLRLGDRTAVATLRRLAEARPDDRDAPAALLLAAESGRDNNLLQEVARRWPEHPAASTARMRLALRRLAAGDSTGAAPFLEAEIRHGGTAAERARFLRARVAEADGERDAARRTYAALAAEDSLGYYGLLARKVAALPDPVVAPAPDRTTDSAIVSLVSSLVLLDSLGLDREADLIVRSLVEREWRDVDQQLDAAEALVRSGRANQAIRIGFAAARRRSLNDARVLRAVFPWPDRALIEAEARAFGLDPFVVAGLIRQESWFLPTARSRAGAVGYMQLMPATAAEVARRQKLPWSPTILTMADANLHLGCAHLAALLRTYGGDLVAAFAAYNAGGTPVRRWRSAPGASDTAGFVEGITYPETQGYVRAVVRNAALYRWLYGPAADAVSP